MIEAAFFDVDHTITKHATGIKYLSMVLKKERLPFSFLFAVPKIFFRYKVGKLRAQTYNDVLEGMDGISEALLAEVAEDCFEKKLKDDIFPQILQLIRDYKSEGIPVILATSSPRFIIEPLYRFLEADYLIATEIEFVDGISTGRFLGEPNFREVKQKRIEDLIAERKFSRDQCIFYSDSIHDLPSMEYIGQPVAVNPDFMLRTIAGERKWPVMDPKLKRK